MRGCTMHLSIAAMGKCYAPESKLSIDFSLYFKKNAACRVRGGVYVCRSRERRCCRITRRCHLRALRSSRHIWRK